MKYLWCDRRLACAVVGMVLLFVLGITQTYDVSTSIAMVCLGVAGANAAEKAIKKQGAAHE